MRRNRRFSIMLLILIMGVSTLLSGAASAGIGTEKVKVIIAFHEQPGPAEEAMIRAFGGSVKFTYNIVPAIAATVPQAALEGLSRNPKVKLIEADVEIHALGETLPWGVDRIDAELVHKAGNIGEGIKVAVIDSGVDYTHDDLEGLVVGGYDFVNNDHDPFDDNGHGTHVAGTIAAVNNEIGVIGVAPGVDIYALKVLDASGSGSFSNIIAALNWCVLNGIKVTNNSYGSSVDPGITVQEAFNNSYGKGILHIASAGNSGKANGRGDNVGFPAQYDSVMAVAATDSNDARAYFSSTGPDVEIAAPGVAILSTVPGGGYESWSGTSMASPHVAGVAALVMASNSGISNVAVRERLVSTAEDLGVTGRDTWFGYGLVDADKAVGITTTPDPNTAPEVIISSPANSSTFDFGTAIYFSGSASDIENGDLSDSIIWTSSIDGQIGIGESFTRVLSSGTHTITAKVTDSGGMTDEARILITVDESTLPSENITVSNLIGSSSTVNKNFWKAQVVATVNPVLSGAVVTGTFGSLTVSGTTDGSGTCTLSSGNISKTIGSIVFELDSVTLNGYTYSTPTISTSITIQNPLQK